MELWIHEDDLFPFFELQKRVGDKKVEISDELLARYEAAMKEFEAVQKILGEMLESD